MTLSTSSVSGMSCLVYLFFRCTFFDRDVMVKFEPGEYMRTVRAYGLVSLQGHRFDTHAHSLFYFCISRGCGRWGNCAS